MADQRVVKQRSAGRAVLYTVLFFVLGGGALVALVVTAVLAYLASDQPSGKTTGRVMDKSHVAIVLYTPEGGRSMTTTIDEDLDVGDEVELRYDPADPRAAVKHQGWGPAVVAGAVLVVLTAGALWSLVRGLGHAIGRRKRVVAPPIPPA
ncbi:hypothetical protein [Spirillospora sp. CA-294931]|uniref:hypothetical protein n=1 Tax=Spirillospora sp. CA-294931 TaxID=3240042 RepID=UPI003D8AC34E